MATKPRTIRLYEQDCITLSCFISQNQGHYIKLDDGDDALDGGMSITAKFMHGVPIEDVAKVFDAMVEDWKLGVHIHELMLFVACPAIANAALNPLSIRVLANSRTYETYCNVMGQTYVLNWDTPEE